MNLHFNFAALWVQVERLTSTRESFSVGASQKLPHINILETLSGEGVEVALDELEETCGLPSYNGIQVLLYIPDHGRYIDDVLTEKKEGNKFHIAYCSKLEEMKNKNRFEKYIASTKKDNLFKINGLSGLTKKPKQGIARLFVCKLCLKKLNFKQAATSTKRRQAVMETFDIQEFFNTYSSCFPYIPSRTDDNIGTGTYTDDWKDISERVRQQHDWQCDECRITLADHRHLLHVHHVDSNKGNNLASNLRPLCIACHRDQPGHSSMFIKRADMQLITRKRALARPSHSNWDDLTRFTDPALHGLLGLVRAKRLPMPELNHALPGVDAMFTLDLAWPSLKTGVSLDPAPYPKVPGWQIDDLAQALERYA
ncbi:MAG TPA: hypothetical protein PLG97_03190 [Alcaligenes sp.]|nr:hypothetical protein [Alcaligenes sp.]HRL26502.1 hypothetical protein [Alcaligenes sp.]